MHKTRSELLWKVAIPLKNGWLTHADYSAMMNYLAIINLLDIYGQIRQNRQYEIAREEAISSLCDLIHKGDVLIFGIANKPRKFNNPQSINKEYITSNSLCIDANEIRSEDRYYADVRIIHRNIFPEDFNGVLSGTFSQEYKAIKLIEICEKQIMNFWQLPVQLQCQEIHNKQKAFGLPLLSVSDASIKRYLRNYKNNTGNLNNANCN